MKPFSSNYISSFTVVGEFASHEEAEAAAGQIRQILTNLSNWQEHHEDQMDAWRDNGDLTGYPLELAEQYNIEWRGAIGWFSHARVDIVFDRFIYITPSQRPEADGQPFDQLIDRLGGKGYHEGNIGGDSTGWVLFNLTCRMPDEQTASAIYKRYLGFNRRIKRIGSQLQFYKWRFDEEPSLTTLVKKLESEGCTGIQFDFQQVIPDDNIKLHGADDFEVLVDVLNNVTDAEDRERAAEVLGDIGDARAVEPLLMLLKDTNSEPKWAVIDALGKIADPTVIQPLIAYLSEEDYWEEVVDILGRIGAPALEPLQQALVNANSPERDRIEKTLQFVHETVRGGKLLADLRNENEMIAQNAFEQVLASGDVDTMLAFLRNPSRGWPNHFQNRVIHALVEIKEERLIPILVDHISYMGYGQDGVIALINFGGTAAVEALIYLEEVHRGYWLREYILGALVRIGDARAFDALVGALNVPVRQSGKIFAPIRGENGEYLLGPAILETIIPFLGKLGDKRAVEPLQKLMGSVHEEMQKVIEEALQNIASQNPP